MQYTYSYVRPKPNSLAAWEIGLPSGHRLILKKRIDHLRAKPYHLAYQGRCTCGKWKPTSWTRKHTSVRHDFMTSHIAEVKLQGTLLGEN